MKFQQKWVEICKHKFLRFYIDLFVLSHRILNNRERTENLIND